MSYKLRRTMMYVPGSNPGMIKDAYIYGADSIMFDLEDSVSIQEKDSARMIVFNALKSLDYSSTEIVVRVNSLDSWGEEDIKAIVHAGVDVVRLPKTETAQDILDVEAIIEHTERLSGKEVGSTKIMAAIESSLGIINAYEIATASKRLMGIAIGAEDFVTDMHTTRSVDGIELLVARSQVLLAARAAKIYAFDSVFSDVNDEEGLIRETKLIKQLGFDGKSVINPRQVDIIHSIYAPTEKEIISAQKVILAAEDAAKRGSGVVSLNGRMVDKPIIERAKRVIMLAQASGIDLSIYGGTNAE